MSELDHEQAPILERDKLITKVDKQEYQVNHSADPHSLPVNSLNKQSIESNGEDRQLQQSKLEGRDYRSENKRLRSMNKQLKKQLQVFEKKLDETLKKRAISEKKPRVSVEKVQNMELQNAYKQCDIYRREVMDLKKKQAMMNEGKVNELVNQIVQMQKQRQQFLQEIKSLKKTIRQQERGLVELAGANIPKMMQENESLREENRKLLQRIQKDVQDTNLRKIGTTNEKRKQRSLHIKTQEDRKKQVEKEESQVQMLKAKANRDNIKMSKLMGQNKIMREKAEEFKVALIEKEKQCQALRQRLASLRKQMKDCRKTKIGEEQSEEASGHKKSISNIENKTGVSNTKETSEYKDHGKSHYIKYPRLVQAGQKDDMAIKWNHHQYSSKIKQVQVCPHPQGFLKQINFRYEKGEPHRLSTSQYATFVCQESSGQYVTKIHGGMKDGLVRFLRVETNKGRISNFCQHELEKECKMFTFGQGLNEFPGAFFGENTSEGINRIGCFIQQIK